MELEAADLVADLVVNLVEDLGDPLAAAAQEAWNKRPAAPLATQEEPTCR